MKGADLKTGVRNLGDRRGAIRSLPEARNALEQIACGVAGVGDRENFSGIGDFIFDQTHRSASQYRGFASTRAGDRKDRSFDVVNSDFLLWRKCEITEMPRHGERS